MIIKIIQIIPEFIKSISCRYYYYIKINPLQKYKFLIFFLTLFKTGVSILKLLYLIILLHKYKNKVKKSKIKNAILIADIETPIKQIASSIKEKSIYENLSVINYSSKFNLKSEFLKSRHSFLLQDIYINSLIKGIRTNSKIFVFEGDKPEHIIVNYIFYILNNTRIGMIQWGSYIYSNLTLAQNFLPYDTYIVKSFLYKNVIARAVTYSKKKEFIICNYQKIKLSKEGAKSLFIVGQPLFHNEIFPPNFVRDGNLISYHKALKILFRRIKKTYPSDRLIYIKHPKEKNIVSNELLFDEQLYLKDLEKELNHNSIFYGFYSSLLVDLHRSNAKIILCCDKYKGTIFNMLLDKENVFHRPIQC